MKVEKDRREENRVIESEFGKRLRKECERWKELCSPNTIDVSNRDIDFTPKFFFVDFRLKKK